MLHGGIGYAGQKGISEAIAPDYLEGTVEELRGVLWQRTGEDERVVRAGEIGVGRDEGGFAFFPGLGMLGAKKEGRQVGCAA